MKNLFWLCLALLACGAPDEPREDRIVAIDGGEIDYSRDYRGDLGTAAEAIYMPYEYGAEDKSIGGFGCIAPWAGGECGVPDSRTLYINVFVDNCPANTAQIIWDTVYTFDTLMTEEGWTVNVAAGSHYNANVEINLDCGSNGALGLWSPEAGSEDCHDTDLGDLCQWKEGDLRLNPIDLKQFYVWVYGTTTQRYWTQSNILLHELFHAAGLGHTGLHMPPRLMDQGWSLDSFSRATDGPMSPEWTQLRMLWCYNESSGTTMRCPP